MQSAHATEMEKVCDEVAELASHIAAATARWLRLLGRLDEEGGWEDGYKTLPDWLSWRCGMTLATARDHVRVAQRLRNRPLIAEAFERGELSYSKVRVLVRLGGECEEQQMLSYARYASASQVETIVRGTRRCIAIEQDADSEFAGREFSWSWDEEGMVVFRGRMPAEQGQVVIRALEAARDELGPPPAEVADGLDPELAEDVLSPRARNADALLAVATTALSEKASSADVYQVVLHVDAGSLTTTREGKAAQNCQFDNGEPVSREAIRRLTCDAAIVPLLQQNGRTIDVGRKTRTISAALRRALQSRDHGCAFPGCSQRHHVDAHHIEHWADGGETNLDNCILLCRFHHMLLHRGRFAVRRAHRGFNWFRADGSPIPNAPRQPRGDCARVTDSTGAPARTTWSLFPEEPTPRGALLGWSVEALLESRDKCDSPPGLAVVGAPHP